MGDLKIGKTIADYTVEIRENNIRKGFRPAEGGPGTNTFGDYIALAHSELSEALEAYRDHRLADATEQLEECWCAMSEATMVSCPQHGYDAPGDDWNPKPEGVGSELADVFIRLVDMADVFGIDLTFEVERKIAYNTTRPYRHGGRTLDGAVQVPVKRNASASWNLGALRDAMPDDQGGRWTGPGVHVFISRWVGLNLPKLTLLSTDGGQLTVWTTEMPRAAYLLGMVDHVGNDGGFTINEGEYSVCIVQAEEK